MGDPHGAADAVVLVCDYVGRRPEAPVSALRLEEHGYTVRYLLTAPYGREVTAAGYADRLARRFGPFGPEVCGVLAYCMAAPIAQELVAAIGARTGSAPPLLIFDPERATEQTIAEQYLLAGRKLGEALDLEAPDDVPPPVPATLVRERPDEAARRMYQGLLRLGDRAVEAGGDPEETLADAEAIAGFYADWLSHLFAAYHAAWPAWDGLAVQVLSRDHPDDGAWPGAGRNRTIRIPTSRDELCRDPECRAAVLAVLREQQEKDHHGS